MVLQSRPISVLALRLKSNDDKLVSLSPKKRNEEELVSFALSADDDAWLEILSDIDDVDDEKS